MKNIFKTIAVLLCTLSISISVPPLSASADMEKALQESMGLGNAFGTTPEQTPTAKKEEEKPSVLDIMTVQILKNYSATNPNKDKDGDKPTIGINAIEQVRKQKTAGSTMFKMPELSPYEEYLSLLTIMQHNEEERGMRTPLSVLTEQSISDLNLYYYDAEHPDFTLTNGVYRGHTIFGKVALGKILGSPVTDVATLQKRQQIVRWLLENDNVLNSLDQTFEKMKNIQMPLISLFNDKDHLYGDHMDIQLYDGEYKSYANNTSPNNGFLLRLARFLRLPPSWYLEFNRWDKDLSPLTAPIKSMVLFYLNFKCIIAAMRKFGAPPEQIARYEFLLNYLARNPFAHAANFGVGTLIGATQIMPTIQGVKMRKAASEHIRNRLHYVSAFAKELTTLCNFLKKTGLPSVLASANALTTFIHDKKSSRAKLLRVLESSTLRQKRSNGLVSYFTSPIGSVLYALPLFTKNKHSFVPLFHQLGQLEAYVSIAKLYRETRETKAQYCFPTYVEGSDTPRIELDDFWHPMINPDDVVRNTLSLGDGYKDMVITGPNTGGKSTAARSIALAVLLGQTIGIAPAASMNFTPFSQINTSLKAVDKIGEGQSLFFAELERGHKLLERTQSAPKDQFVLNILDEIFSGTAPLQGEASSFSLAHGLGMLPNGITLIATHFPKLTTLPRHTHGAYKNFKVVAIKHPNYVIDLPYLLEEGRSTQTIVLELLRRDGFNPALVDRAEAFIRREHPEYDKL